MPKEELHWVRHLSMTSLYAKTAASFGNIDMRCKYLTYFAWCLLGMCLIFLHLKYNPVCHVTSPTVYQVEQQSLPVEHKSQKLPHQYIFVGGMLNSGTTLMRALLDVHPDVSCGEATPFIADLLNMKTTFTTVFETKLLNEAGVTSHVLNSAIQKFILEFMGKPGDHAHNLCSEDTFALANAVYLGEIFPDAKFLLMIRDGRAVAHSMTKKRVRGHNTLNPEKNLNMWNTAMTQIYAQCQIAGSNRCLPVYYEQLILQPELWLGRVLSFLGIPWDDSILHHQDDLSAFGLETGQTETSFDRASLTSWVGELPDELLKQMPQTAPMLALLGYDPLKNTPNYDKPPPAVADNTQHVQNQDFLKYLAMNSKNPASQMKGPSGMPGMPGMPSNIQNMQNQAFMGPMHGKKPPSHRKPPPGMAGNTQNAQNQDFMAFMEQMNGQNPPSHRKLPPGMADNTQNAQNQDFMAFMEQMNGQNPPSHRKPPPGMADNTQNAQNQDFMAFVEQIQGENPPNLKKPPPEMMGHSQDEQNQDFMAFMEQVHGKNAPNFKKPPPGMADNTQHAQNQDFVTDMQQKNGKTSPNYRKSPLVEADNTEHVQNQDFVADMQSKNSKNSPNYRKSPPVVADNTELVQNQDFVADMQSKNSKNLPNYRKSPPVVADNTEHVQDQDFVADKQQKNGMNSRKLPQKAKKRPDRNRSE